MPRIGMNKESVRPEKAYEPIAHFAASFDEAAQRLTAAFRGDLQRYRRGVVWPMTGVDFNADHQRQPRKLIESREYLEVWPVDVDADEVESFMTARACGDFCHSIGCDLRQ